MLEMSFRSVLSGLSTVSVILASCVGGSALAADSEVEVSGSWSYSDGRLDLQGDGWTVTFESDSTRVTLLDRADTLSSLRWVTSSGGSPFSACDLVSASEFVEFVHPTEGSGSEGM